MDNNHLNVLTSVFLKQVRRLVERAHSVSKSWDDAPVVLCGDFNCTPKVVMLLHIKL